jgi:hypothetical protein
MLCYAALGQVNQTVTAKLSPLTKRYLHQLKKSKGKVIPGYVYNKKPGGRVYLSALIKVSDVVVAQSGLTAIGAAVGTKAGKVWTVKVPVENVAPFTRLHGISYIQLDVPVTSQLDEAHKASGKDSM